MGTTMTPTKALALPDDLLIGTFQIELNIESEQEALHRAELLFAEVRGVVLGRNPGFALFYDIEFEITETWRSSSGFGGKIWGRVRDRWRKIAKATPRAYAFVVLGLGAIAGYPDLRKGGVQIGEDVKSAWVFVMDRHKESEPNSIKKAECEASEDGTQGRPRRGSPQRSSSQGPVARHAERRKAASQTRWVDATNDRWIELVTAAV